MPKLLVIIISCFLFANAYATSRMGRVEIHVLADEICFTLPHEEFYRSHGEMTYYGYYVDKNNEIIWGYRVESIPFKEGDCYKYGVLPYGVKVGKGKFGTKLPEIAPVLQQNTLYSVTIFADTNDPTDPTLGYEVSFCLKNKNNEVIVEQGNNACNDISHSATRPSPD